MHIANTFDTGFAATLLIMSHLRVTCVKLVYGRPVFTCTLYTQNTTYVIRAYALEFMANSQRHVVLLLQTVVWTVKVYKSEELVMM